MTLLIAMVSLAVRAADETITTMAVSGEGEDFSWTTDKGDGASAPALNSGSIRLYAGNTITFSSSTKKLAKIELTVARNKHYWTDASVDAGTVSTATNSNFVWEADDEATTSVTITNSSSGSGNLQIKEIAVTYVEEGLKTPHLTIDDIVLMRGHYEDLSISTESDGYITFSSEDGNIATASDFDPSNGATTWVYGDGTGTTTITATQAETEEYASATVTFQVTVTPKQSPNLSIEDAFVKIEHYEDLNISTESDGYITFSSEDGNIATASDFDPSNGATTWVYGNGTGTTTITATQAETEEYEEATVTFQVTVTEKDPTILTVGTEEVTIVRDHEQTIALSTNSDGYISTESSDADVAEAFANDGEVTIYAYQPGTATITISQVETEEMAAAETTIQVTVIDKQDPQLSVEPSTISLLVNNKSSIVISTESDGAISFTSSDNRVADAYGVDGEYEVETYELGTATITISQDETDSFSAAEVTLTVNVLDPLGAGAYELVTTDDLQAGDEIIIANTETKKAISTTQNNNNRSSSAITIDGVYAFPTDDTEIFTLEEQEDGYWYLKTHDDKYIYASSNSSNQLKTTDSQTTAAQASISIDADGIAAVVFNRTGRNTLRYNSTSDLYACYAPENSQKDVSIYRKMTASSAELTISASTYATIYYEHQNLVVPESVTAYAAEKNGSEIILHAFDGIIPAGQPALVNGEPGTYRFLFTNDEGVEPEANDLVGSENGGIDDEPGYKYYVLSWRDANKNVDEVGFYYQSGSKGAWAQVKEHQAYMKVSDALANESGFTFVADSTTAISAIDQTLNDGDQIYTLTGVRVSNTANLPRGIYIINGKKAVKK